MLIQENMQSAGENIFQEKQAKAARDLAPGIERAISNASLVRKKNINAGNIVNRRHGKRRSSKRSITTRPLPSAFSSHHVPLAFPSACIMASGT